MQIYENGKYNENLTIEDMINFVKEQKKKIELKQLPTIKGKIEFSYVKELLKEEMIGFNDATYDYLDIALKDIDNWYNKLTLPSYQEYDEYSGKTRHGNQEKTSIENMQYEVFAAIIYNGLDKRDGIIVTENENNYCLREFVLCGDNFLAKMNGKVINKEQQDELTTKIKSVASKTKESPLNQYLMVLNNIDFQKISELHKIDKYARLETLSELYKLRQKENDYNFQENIGK